jgi:type II secretory pathway pseudopilin PulG
MKTRSFAKGALAALVLATLPITSAWAAYRSEAEQAIAEAKAVQQKAAAAGIATQDTAALIKEAEGLLPLRGYTKAIELANKAKKQDEFALSQAGAGKGEGAAPTDSGKQAEAEQAIADAEAARKKAASAKGEWRDTKKMIKEAEELMKSGEFDAAIKMANQAKRQGELGYEQALSQKGADFPDYVLKQMKE